MSNPIYLDYAAATPVDDAALKAAQLYLQSDFYNPSAIYQAARHVRDTVEAARATVADVLGCRDQEIFFTAGGTEANNLAITGVMSLYPEANCIVSSIEHESVLEPAAQYNRKLAPVTEQGLLDLPQIESLIDDHTALISVMYANNEIGTIQPIKQLTELVNAVKTQRLARGNTLPLYVHADACQAANYLDLHVSRLGVDMMTLNGGKIYSYKQSGCLYVSRGVHLTPLIRGGGQEVGLRSGTENPAALIAFATMLQKVQSERKDESERLQSLRNTLSATLSQKISHTAINGSMKHRLPNNLNLTFSGIDGERLVMQLDEDGVQAATGSACSASSDEPSHVLLALGLSSEEASASLRLTLGRQTTEAEINKAAQTIQRAVQLQR
ncbi:cysteine desulfurase [Candidatus Saccharibacteria bacterium]|nr:cysteine desulfurase [Candidatus Saccharibacteria bacterium]